MLHAAVCILFTRVCIVVAGLRKNFAAIAGILFAVHPIHTEAVSHENFKFYKIIFAQNHRHFRINRYWYIYVFVYTLLYINFGAPLFVALNLQLHCILIKKNMYCTIFIYIKLSFLVLQIISYFMYILCSLRCVQTRACFC